MHFGLLTCSPLPVEEAVEFEDLDGQYVAVHGVLYYGKGCEENEFLLLPKSGSFSGVESIPMPAFLDRDRCLLIEEPDMDRRLGGSSVIGIYRYKEDAIVVGQIKRRPGTRHPVRIGDLWLVLLQHWLDHGRGRPSHRLRVACFPHQPAPLPWRGFKGKRHVAPVLWVEDSKEDPKSTQDDASDTLGGKERDAGLTGVTTDAPRS